MGPPDPPYAGSDGPPSLRLVTSNGSSTAPAPMVPPPAHVREDSHDISPPPRGGLLHPDNGNRTPRRLQWASDSHIVQMHSISPVASPVTQVDLRNLGQVDAALERHRSNPSRRRPLSDTSVESGGHGSEEDYDYRLDVDPPSENLEHVKSNDSQKGEEYRFQDLLDTGVNEHISGERIQLGETDGLPNLRRRETEDDLQEAKGIVRAHTGKWGVLRRRVKGAGAVTRAFNGAASSTRHGVDPEKSEPQTEGFANRCSQDEPGMPRGMNLPGGASVLSSLLALYGQQNGLESGTTSAASSRPASEDSFDDLEERKRLLQSGRDLFNRQQQLEQPPNTTNDTSGSGTPGEMVIHDESRGHRPSVVEDEEGNRRPSLPLDLHTSHSSPGLSGRPPAESPGFRDLFDKAKTAITQGKDRPKAARSGAGVFGALIQNTQNISGAATPAASVLAPAAHRPGYQLSRYSAPNIHDPPPKVWRPTSRSSSRPGSVHSSTAVSQNQDDSPSTMRGEDADLKKNASSDDMLSMRKKNKSALSLHKLPGAILKDPRDALHQGGQAIRNAEKWITSGGRTPLFTPPEKGVDGYFDKPLTEDERRRKEWEKEKRRRKKQKEARKKQEIFIIQHVAAVLARQQFLLKLARALMMFGSPSHRLETQIQATAKVLELNAQVVYLPGIMLISFGDEATHTSETKFLKQATGLDLGKLLATHHLYWNVVHDRMSVDEASKELDMLMTTPTYYNNYQMLLIGAVCSAFITVIGFHGSFIDALMAMPLGVLLVGVQTLAARNDMFSNVFEITIATIISFIAAALASTGYFCYTALVSGGVVLILPGYIVLCGALELASRNITAGAVRIGYSVIYSLFLGFGISIGAELYIKITGLTVVGSSDYTCDTTHSGKPWWGVTPSAWWYFLCCPGYAFVLSLRLQQPFFAKELPIMVLMACAGWCSNHFSAIAFPNRSDLTSAVGSFVVGTLGNIYGKLSHGSSFPVTVVGILFQLPSGLSNGGIFNFASDSTSSGSEQAWSSGFQVAQQLVSVAIGLTVGLFVSAVVTHPFGGGRRSGSGIFSF